MAQTKAEIRGELERMGVVDVPASATKGELEQRLAAARGNAAAAGGVRPDEAQMLVTRNSGRMRIRVTDGTTIVHGDPDAGEERRVYEGGDELVVPAPDATMLTLGGQAIMLGAPADNEGSEA